MRTIQDVFISTDDRQLSIEKCRYASHRITAVFEDLLKHDVVRSLPHTAINIILEAVTNHRFNLVPGDHVLPRQSITGLRTCLRVFEGIQDFSETVRSAYW